MNVVLIDAMVLWQSSYWDAVHLASVSALAGMEA